MALYVQMAGDDTPPLGEDFPVPPRFPDNAYPDDTVRLREVQIRLISAVMSSYGAIRYGESLAGTAMEKHAVNGLAIQREKYEGALRRLAEYTHTDGPGLTVEGRIELIRAAGEDQKKIIVAALTR